MIYLILFFGFFLRLIGINQSLWLDEAAQAIVSSSDLKSIWLRDADFHPPLFHTILHFWEMISTNEVFMRILPLFFGILSIYALYIFAKKHFSEKVALTAAFLLAVSPFHVIYSQELRSYSLLVLMGILSVHFLFEKKWKTYVLINVLGFFTNYVYVFVIFSELIWVFISRKKSLTRNFLLAQFILVVVFVLWLPEFLFQLKAGSTLMSQLPEWRMLSSPNFLIAIPLTIFKFIGGKIAISRLPLMIFYASLINGIFLWIFYGLYKRINPKSLFLFLMIFVPLILALLISFFIPLNNPPRLIFVVPFICLGVAYFIDLYKDKHLIYIFFLISVFGIFMQNAAFINRKEDWKSAVSFIDKNTINKTHALSIFEFPGPFAPWIWYEKNGIDAVGAVPTKANSKDLQNILSPKLFGKTQVYLFEYFADITDPERLTRKFLEKNGFIVVSVYDFNNLGFIYEMRRPSLF